MSDQWVASLRAKAPSQGQGYFIFSQGSNWPLYLKAAAEIGSGQPHLCHVLARNAEEQGGRFPWVTPVIGSGCSGALSRDQEIELSALPARLASAAGDGDLADGTEHGELVYAFASAMVEARYHGLTLRPRTQMSEDAGVIELVTTLQCVEAAALLYRARHVALGITGRPVREFETIKLPDGMALQELHYSRLLPARSLLVALSSQPSGLSTSDVLKAHQDLFKALARKVPDLPQTELRITARDLEALVEVAWQLMIAPLGVYPGWRDLMTASAFSSFEDDLAQDFSVLDTRQARPKFETVTGFEHQWNRIRVALGRATEVASRDSGERSQFFDALAKVLTRQSVLRSARQSGPFTSAFVTSFDLELEMALARQGADFTMLVPYYLTHGSRSADSTRRPSPEHIAPIWLATHVKSEEVEIGSTGCWTSEFDEGGAYLSGFKPRWRLAGITPKNDPLVVVRLVGSPLMPKALMAGPGKQGESIPYGDGLKKRREDLLYVDPDSPDEYDTTLSQGLSAGLAAQGVRIYEPVQLDPALIIDEYAGLHQIKSSWLSTFPNAVTQGDESTFRYWCGAGVQLDDSLVRLLTAAYLEPVPTGRSSNQALGAVVNLSFALPQADFLRWQGFAPVKDDYRVLTPELEHLASHLQWEIDAQEKHEAIGESFSHAHQNCAIPWIPGGPSLASRAVKGNGDAA